MVKFSTAIFLALGNFFRALTISSLFITGLVYRIFSGSQQLF
jgi:hypothetical protein